MEIVRVMRLSVLPQMDQAQDGDKTIILIALMDLKIMVRLNLEVTLRKIQILKVLDGDKKIILTLIMEAMTQNKIIRVIVIPIHKDGGKVIIILIIPMITIRMVII